MHSSYPIAACRLVSMGIAIAALLCASNVQAAITDTSGRIDAAVQVTDVPSGEHSDQATQGTFDGSAGIASAETAIEIIANEASQGRVISAGTVNAPYLASSGDTDDFSLEATGLSLLAERGFASTSTATQTRQITLSATELGRRSGTVVRVRSRFAIDAGIVLLTRPGGPTDVTGRIDLAVQQEDEDGSREVLAGSIEVAFGEDGTLQIVSTGDLDGVTTISLDLADADGADEKVDQAKLVLLPAVELPYEYDAVVDRPFSLVATINAGLTSPSGNQAGSTFVGGLPLLLAENTDEYLQVVLADDLDLISQLLAGGTGLPGGIEILPTLDDTFSGCGSFGLEGILLGAAGLGLVARRLV